MTVSVTPEPGALVVVARTSGHQDPLAEVSSMLANLTECRVRLVLDLSGVTLAPYARVSSFMGCLAQHAQESGCPVVIVADRMSARRVLRALSPDQTVRVAASVPAALGAPGQAHGRSAGHARVGIASAPAVARRAASISVAICGRGADPGVPVQRRGPILD